MDIIRNGAIFAVNADAVRSPVPRFAVKGAAGNMMQTSTPLTAAGRSSFLTPNSSGFDVAKRFDQLVKQSPIPKILTKTAISSPKLPATPPADTNHSSLAEGKIVSTTQASLITTSTQSTLPEAPAKEVAATISNVDAAVEIERCEPATKVLSAVDSSLNVKKSKDIILTSWFVAPYISNQQHQPKCIVGGIRSDTNEAWTTSPISTRISERVVQTASGSVYILEGPMNKTSCLSRVGVTETFVKKFLNGFPANWQTVVNILLGTASKRLHSSNDDDETEEEEEFLETKEAKRRRKSFTPSKSRTPKKPSLVASTPSLLDVSSLDKLTPEDLKQVLPTTRSGRLAKKPCDWWRNEKFTYDTDGNIIEASTGTVDLNSLSSERRKLAAPVSVVGPNRAKLHVQKQAVVKAKTPAPAVKTAAPLVSKVAKPAKPESKSVTATEAPIAEKRKAVVKLAEEPSQKTTSVTEIKAHIVSPTKETATTRSTNTRPKRVIVKVDQKDSDESEFNSEEEAVSSDEEADYETRVPKSKPSKKSLSKSASKKSKSQSAGKEKRQDNDELQSKWTQQELNRLDHAMLSLPSTAPMFWQKVALKVGTKTEQECFDQHAQISEKDNMKPVKVTRPKKTAPTETGTELDMQITAKVGTQLRKRQVRAVLDHLNKGHSDDLFDTTPYKKLKIHNEAAPAHPAAITLHLTTPHKQSTALNDDSPSSVSDSPGFLMKPVDRDLVDGYVARIKTKTKHLVSPSGPQVQRKNKPKTSSGNGLIKQKVKDEKAAKLQTQVSKILKKLDDTKQHIDEVDDVDGEDDQPDYVWTEDEEEEM